MTAWNVPHLVMDHAADGSHTCQELDASPTRTYLKIVLAAW